MFLYTFHQVVSLNIFHELLVHKENIEGGSHHSCMLHNACCKLHSCKIREAIRCNRNRIFIGITSCRVYDRFFVKRCNKCQEFGHYKENCPKVDVCGYCSENHPSEECSLKNETDLTLLKCANCKVNNLECSGHSTFWSKCPSYIIAQKRLKSTISYYDNHACTAGHLND